MAGLGALGALSSTYTISSDSEDDENYSADKSAETSSVVIVKTEVVDEAFNKYAEGSVPMQFDFGSIALKENESKDEVKDKETVQPRPNDITEDEEDPVYIGEQFVGQSYSAFRVKEEPTSDKETSDSEADSSDDEDSDDDEDDESNPKKREPPRVKGEMTFKDLPPIEDLQISVPHEQVKPIGVIKSFVDPLVVVEALPNTPALDIDSILFLDEGDRTLGAIYDVIGQVKQPFYCVRFNSLEHIASRGVEKGMAVYCAPSTSHTSYVLVAQLKKLKGSDASWQDDIEPPPEAQEFSDDEAERAAKKKGRKRGQNKGNGQESDGVQIMPQETYQGMIPRNPLGGYRKPFRPRRGHHHQVPFRQDGPGYYNGPQRPPFRQRGPPNPFSSHGYNNYHHPGVHTPWVRDPEPYQNYPDYSGQFQNGSNNYPPPPPPAPRQSHNNQSWDNNYVAPPQWPHPHVQSYQPPPPGTNGP